MNITKVVGKRKKSPSSLSVDVFANNDLGDVLNDPGKTGSIRRLVCRNGEISLIYLQDYLGLSLTSTKILPSAKQRKDVANFNELGDCGGRLVKFCNSIV